LEIYEKCLKIYNRLTLPETKYLGNLVNSVIDLLDDENENIRPVCSHGLPGGLIKLPGGMPVIVVPDLHARGAFILALLKHEIDGVSVETLLSENKLQVVCVGDGFHSEFDKASRWRSAFLEYQDDFRWHDAMDAEMRESLGLMEMIMLLKLAYSDNFHFLKGNHENILNEDIDGNRSFMKYSMEGPMVRYFMEKFYGFSLLEDYAAFEKRLPLLVVGDYFLVSHAEPAQMYIEKDILEFRDNPDVVFGLTWTANDAAEEGSVADMLKSFLGENGRWYIAGHRTIKEDYRLRADGRFVQIHNPSRFQIAFLPADRNFDPTGDIVVLRGVNVE